MFARLNKTYKELGAVNTMIYLSNRIVATLSFRRMTITRCYITRQGVTSFPAISPDKEKNIEVREIFYGDPVCAQIGRPAELIRARFDQGGHCYAAFRKGVIAGFLWLNYGHYREEEMRCRFILSPFDKSAWDYDVFIYPKHRLSYTFLRLWEFANETMRQKGIETIYSRVNYYNTASLNSHKKLGTEVIGSIYFLQFFQMQLSVSPNFRPGITFSRNRQIFPNIFIP